jgi:trypsin
VLLAALALCMASCLGGSASAAKRIYGGYYPSTAYAPWVTWIKHSRSFCSASLIAPKRVLTAAHCVAGGLSNPADWKAYVGIRNRDGGGGESRNVTAIAVHPNVSLPTTGLHTNHAFYDVAVMFLDSAVSTPPGAIGTDADWGSVATAMGWGHSNLDHENPAFDPNVRAVNLSLGSDAQCNAWINDDAQHYFPAIHICAYDAEGDDCITHGDSGGPLIINGKIIGVTSFFPSQQSWGVCQYDSMTGFAWVAGPTLRSWLTGVTNPACPQANRDVGAASALVAAAQRKLRRAKHRGRRKRRRAKRALSSARQQLTAAQANYEAICNS